MPDLRIDAALWIVEDARVAGIVAPLTEGAPSVRLDLPGWRVALDALSTDGPVAVAVGGGSAVAELGTVLGLLAGGPPVELLLCDGPGPEAFATALAWSGGAVEDLGTVQVDGTPVLRLRLAAGEAGPVVPLLTALAGRAAARRAGRRRVGVAWRVGLVGSAAWSRLGDWVHPVAVPHDALGELALRVGHLDALVLSPSEDWDDGDLGALATEARDLGIPVVAVGVGPGDGRPGGDHGATAHPEGAAPWADAADVRLGPDRPHPVRVTVVNPQGWRRNTPDVLSVVPAADPDDAETALGAIRARLDGRNLRVVGDASTGDDPGRLAGLLQVLRDGRGVVDHPGLHRDAVRHAAWLVQLSAAAVPVVCLELPAEVATLLGDELAGALRGGRLADLDDPDERERRTVLTRRAAWRTHTVEAAWRELGPRLGLPAPRRRSFSLVLATNRPDFVEHALGQVDRQRWRPAELVVALHGEAFTAGVEDRVRAGTDLATTVLRVRDEEPLGEVLNQACQAASGDVITKWDDDDWYSPDHLLDLAIALDHSGAQLVGKAAEFVYLAAPDLTMRRFTTGAETGSRSIAGGTLTFPRDVWRDLGGFARIGVGEDQQLIGDVLAAGGTIHRTHGFGYLLHRHGHHAWSAEDTYFRAQAEAERPGRDHEWTLT